MSYRASASRPQSRVLETTHTLEHIFFYCFSMLGFVYDTCSRDSLKGWGRAACASSLALRSMSRVLGLSQPDMLFLPCVFIVSSNVTQGSLHLSVVKCHAEISTLECNKTWGTLNRTCTIVNPGRHAHVFCCSFCSFLCRTDRTWQPRYSSQRRELSSRISSQL